MDDIDRRILIFDDLLYIKYQYTRDSNDKSYEIFYDDSIRLLFLMLKLSTKFNR